MEDGAVWALIGHIAASLCVGVGVLFVLIGAAGMVRLPDFYTRMHAAGITDTLGAELVLLGLMIEAGWSLAAAKLALIGFFLFLTSPTSTHAVANAAYVAGVKPILARVRSNAPDGESGEDGAEEAS